jgi:hypothetical protein
MLLITLLTSCKNKEKVEADATVDAEKNAMYNSVEFKEFYDRFGKDSVYQMDHIVFPLEGLRRLEDSLDVVPPDFRWQRENWIIHKPFDDTNESFLRSWTDIGGTIVVESIQDNSGRYTMERRFGKLSSGWHLIYYSEMGIH